MFGFDRLVLSSILVILGILVCRFKWSTRPSASACAVCFAVVMILNGVFVAASFFTGRGIDYSVIYHLNVGLHGAGYSVYLTQIGAAAGYLMVVLIGSFFLFKVLARRNRASSSAWKVAAGGLGLMAVVASPAVHDFYRLWRISTLSSYSHSVPEEFTIPNSRIAKGKNVVFVYLESVERTYLNPKLFPGLMPNIQRLESQGVSFTDIRQVGPTGWTIAGMVASQCGLPLISSSDRNTMSGLDQFLPEATCLGDILSDSGYGLTYMGGAALSFAGKGSFYRTHGFKEVLGTGALSKQMEDTGYRSGWGIYDDTLFELAKAKFSRLSKAEGPFGLFLLTLDTHSPNGHVSDYCRDHRYGDGTNPILNAVHCADRQAAEFVDYIRSSEHGDNTIIVLASDHIAMRNSAWEALEKGDRRNLFVILDPSEATPREVTRPGSTLDIGPTLLSALGMPNAGLGFGRSLLSDTPSLTEELADFGRFLDRQREFVAQMWQYPQVKSGISFDQKNGVLVLGKEAVKPPVLFLMDRNAYVHGVVFDSTGPRKVEDHLVDMPHDQPMLWVDKCAKITAFAQIEINEQPSAKWCAVAGSPATASPVVHELKRNSYITESSIRERLGAPLISSDLVEERISAARYASRYGVRQVQKVILGDAGTMGGDVVVRSSGNGGGRSFLEYKWGDNLEVLRFGRGLTLVGLSNHQRPQKLKHVDTCAYQHAYVDQSALNLPGTFGDVIATSAGDFDAYTIVGHDSVVCAERYDMEKLFSGLSAAEWRRIEHRQPYIGVLLADGTWTEWLGKRERTMAINLKHFIGSHSSSSYGSMPSK